MDEAITAYVGLDAHAESTAIAVAQADRTAPQFVGTARDGEVHPLPSASLAEHTET